MRLTILETNSDEETLLYNLIRRGRQADVPYYFSVDKYEVNIGRVIFARLDCAPAPAFMVAVAGKKIMFREDCDVSQLKSWLKGWNISYMQTEEKEFSDLAEVKIFVNKLRERELGTKARSVVVANLKIRLGKLHQKEEQELGRAVDADLARRSKV